MTRLRDCESSLTYGNLEFRVKWNWMPGTPDVWYLPNGDPGYPGEPSELEIEEFALILPSGEELDVSSLLDLTSVFDWVESSLEPEITLWAESLLERPPRDDFIE